ncbi:hypothetical protein L3N51_01761 [Metallosphaera sp. J1]|uniref:antitoxin VapB family protein n=1 Tax=Metallosphaera TaxID=41980 RepID=UPI001EDFB56A|nr:antitoxin VapB family protein [Metallosphaera javensis (ex Hofmann et al. 2022)]MCG3109469.1 hypothetical protein [Metallosphaera javensis (ex Hofmann et al. 2022)]BCS93498.1 MAG: antitoxin [Metallosphaera javensis (ex Sakai et al. 2022)]
MKTIMIRDDVYERLLEIKGDRSFSELIDQLIRESRDSRNKRLMRYFGILTDEEANKLEEEVKRAREKLDESISRHVRSD